MALLAAGLLAGATGVWATTPDSTARFAAATPPRTTPHAAVAAKPPPVRVAGVGRLQGLVFQAASEAVAGMPAAPAATHFVPGRILVAQRTGSSDANFQQALTAVGASSLGRLTGIDVHVVAVAAGNEQAAANGLAGNPHVRFAELDQVAAPAATANDPFFGKQWHLTKINVPTAWNVSSGAGLTIAILDTGVDGTHADLSSKMVPGWNFFDNNSNTADVFGHGTAIAGVAAAAANNGIGVAGVAAAARVMPLRITDAAGHARWSLAAQGLIWAADQGARVANISFQGMAASHTVQTAIAYVRARGGVVVAAAGNAGAVDATAVSDGMLVVSATDSQDRITSWSTRGSLIDIAAPGADVYSTAKGGGYGSWSGTSISASIVAGTAALVMSLRPDLTPAQVESALLSSATDLGAAGYDIDYGYGRVNAAAAVDTAAGLPSVPSCTRANPAVNITPPSATVRPGITVNFSIAVTNNDTAGCGASSFAFTQSVPAGWSVNALAPVALSPGAATTATLQVTSPAGAANSSNPIHVTLTNQNAATYSRLASATYVIGNTAPGAPTIGTATAGNAQATVSFTPPASNGGSAITSYTVTASPGGRTASGAASPLTVTGLTNGTAYTFRVTATNAVGTSAASAASNSVTPVGASPAILWSANHEGGNLSEWSLNGGGLAQGFLNYVPDTSGTVKVEVSTAQAQSGTRSARLEMPQGTGNQAQLIRWRESQTNADLYYSVWLYFPQNIDTRGGGWFNLLQIHTKNGGWTIPIGIEVKTQANGTNTFFLHSPYSTTSAWNTGGMPYWEYTSSVPIPIGRWFNVELRFKRDPTAGVVQFWQEGTQIFNVQNVQTTHAGATYHEFYVNIYGLGISPSPTVIYVDNVAISASRIGP